MSVKVRKCVCVGGGEGNNTYVTLSQPNALCYKSI